MAPRPKPKATSDVSPVGTKHRTAMRKRAGRNSAYRKEMERLAPYERIARLVIARRGALGLSQKELAARMGTSHSAISRIEGGQHPTSVETLRRLAAALETRLVVGFSDAETEQDAMRDLVALT